MDDNQQKGFKSEKGTDYPKEPMQEKGTDFPKTPQAPSAPAPPPPPKAPPVPESSGVVGSKIVFWIIGGLVVIGIGFGIFVYTKYQSLPFRIDDDRIIIEDSKGDKLELDRNPSLPGDFPDDIPIFPNSELTASARLLDSDASTTTSSVFTWEAGSSSQTVVDYYRSALPDNGWNIRQLSETEDGAFIIATKGDLGFSLLISRKSGVTQIILTFGS